MWWAVTWIEMVLDMVFNLVPSFRLSKNVFLCHNSSHELPVPPPVPLPVDLPPFTRVRASPVP